MIIIAAISGLIIAGITITIFMAPAGPCDPVKNLEPPPFVSPRGAGLPKGASDWVKDLRCGLFNPPKISQKTQSSQSASIAPTTADSSPDSSTNKTRLKAAFSFDGKREGSLRKSSNIEIRGNVAVEIKEDGTSTENLFDWLPIKLVLKAGTRAVWQAEITKESGCREYLHTQRCSLTGYKYDSSWDGQKLYLYAYDKNGRWLAFHYEE